MKPNSRRATPRLRRRARSLAACRRSLQPRDLCRAIRSISLTKTSRIMPVAGGGFEQCYNAQAAVAAGSLLVVAIDVVLAPNDKQQLEPMLGKIGTLPEELGEPETLLADTGYFSAANVEACEKAGIEPLIAMGRQPHHPPLTERFETAPPAPENPTPVEAMAHRLKTPEGRKVYALRKQTPEPVFGIIKAVLGFRQFSLRGLDKVRGEWNLVTMAWNMKEDVCPHPRLTRPCVAWRRESRRLPVNRGDHNAIWTPPNVRGSWPRQNRPRRSATKPQSDGLI